jgi:hypothetical protein
MTWIRRPLRIVWLWMLLSCGCYTVPTTPPPAGPQAALAAPKGQGGAAISAVSLCTACRPGDSAIVNTSGQPALDEAVQSREELQRLRQEILNLRERMGKAEQENLKTIRSIEDSLDQVLKQENKGRPEEQPSEWEQPRTPEENPEPPILPELPPLKRNGS